jgi:hypothetical protein
MLKVTEIITPLSNERNAYIIKCLFLLLWDTEFRLTCSQSYCMYPAVDCNVGPECYAGT